MLHRFRRYAGPWTPNTEISESKLFIFSNYYNGKTFNLQYQVSFCLISTRVCHQYTHVPASRTFLSPHSPDYCSLLSQSTGFGCPASCTELAPVICLCLVIYMLHCYSLKSSHHCPLHSLFFPSCLFCCPACRIIMAISPNFIHMHSYTGPVFLFLTLLHSVEEAPVSPTSLELT